MADVFSKLDEITDMVEAAKAVPLSASCMLNRTELLAAIDQARELLPEDLAEARRLLAERAEFLEGVNREAEQLRAEANKERAHLVSRAEIAREAAQQAEQIIADARETARLMRLEVEDYVDAKLANFEVVLHKTLRAVERGREKLRGCSELEQLRDPAWDEPIPGHSGLGARADGEPSALFAAR